MINLNFLRTYLDKKLLLIIIVFYSTFSLISSIRIIYLKSIDDNSIYTNVNWSTIFLGNQVIDYVLVIIFMSLVLMITKYMVSKKFSWIAMSIVHMILAIVLGAYIFIGIGIFQKIIFAISSPINLTSILHAFIYSMDVNFLVYFSLVSIFHTYFYLTKMKETEVQQVKLKEDLIKSELKGLKSQMQPHFLFNTLNNIHSLIDIDVGRAKSIIVDLGTLLRKTIDYNSENLIRLKDEIILLDKYLRIVQLSHSDSLKIIHDVDVESKEVLIPSMLLQSSIENAIKHGYSEKHSDLTIKVNIQKLNAYLFISIENNGQKLIEPVNKIISNGSGIKNVISRLKIIYADDFYFKISNSEFGVRVMIKIPENI